MAKTTTKPAAEEKPEARSIAAPAPRPRIIKTIYKPIPRFNGGCKNC